MKAQFIYTKGDWREFRGRVFVQGKPTIVDDDATIELLSRDAEFERVKEDIEHVEAVREKAAKAAPTEVLIPPPLPAYPRREILKARRR